MSEPKQPQSSHPPPCLPGANCLLAIESLRELRDDMREIKQAIKGSPELGLAGFGHRLNAVESKVESHDRKLFVWGAILTAAGVVATFLKDKLIR